MSPNWDVCEMCHGHELDVGDTVFFEDMSPISRYIVKISVYEGYNEILFGQRIAHVSDRWGSHKYVIDEDGLYVRAKRTQNG